MQRIEEALRALRDVQGVHGSFVITTSGELVAPFQSTADPARAYFAIVSKRAEGRPEVADFVAWLRSEAKESR